MRASAPLCAYVLGGFGTQKASKTTKNFPAPPFGGAIGGGGALNGTNSWARPTNGSGEREEDKGGGRGEKGRKEKRGGK